MRIFTVGTKLNYCFAILLIFILNTFVVAAPVVPTHFTHLSVQDGLSQVTVSDIIEDNIGFMWFSTQNGLNRYDGYNFVNYKKDQNLDGSGPMGDYVYKMALNKTTGDLWAASSRGLSRYDQKHELFVHYPLIDSAGIQHHFVATVVYDRTGKLWAGTNLGLFEYNPNSDSFIHVELNQSAKFRIQDIEQDINGVIWLATSQGLYAFKEDRPLYTIPELEGIEVSDIELINKNQIWFSTNGKGIYAKQDTTDLRHIIKPLQGLSSELSSPSVSSIKQIRNGDIWISTLGGLTITRSENNAEIINLNHKKEKNNLLSGHQMSRTFESQSGLIWQGTWRSGFSKFDPSSLQFKTLLAGNDKSTRGMTKDNQGNVWFGTPEGLWKRDMSGQIAGPWTFENKQNNVEFLESNMISSLAYSESSDTIWIGTRSGLAYLKKNQKYLKHAETIQGARIYTLTADEIGDLWLGGFNNGLIYVDGKSHKIKKQWPMGSVTKILLDADGFVWVGTMEGLLRINKHTGEVLDLYAANRSPANRSPRIVTWISKSKNGQHYWLGAQGSGILKLSYDEKTDDFIFQQVAPGSHLSTLAIGGIEEDSKGNLWASTIEGIAKLGPSLENPEYFNDSHGVKIEGYYINHSLTNIDSKIFFGSPVGLTYFSPEDASQSKWSPAIVFTKLSILGNRSANTQNEPSTHQLPIYQAKEIVLQPEDLVFSIEFSALDLSAPTFNQYKYKLNGFDTTWNTTSSTNRVATYTNLDAGSYTLIVKGTNKDGIWSDQVGEITITVIPPWWLTTWAKVLWISIIVTLLIGFYRRRVYALKKRSDLLSIQVEERTAELEAMNKKLLRLSTIDDLTGLRNRRDFRNNALQELSRFKRGGEPFCILLIDIDYFKQVNDVNGHTCGDKVLIETAQVMQSHIRQQDFLARWGGEEFIMMIVDTDTKQGAQIAEKIRLAVAKNIVEYEEQEICVSITIGVSQIYTGEELDACINRADKNLYLGKNDGRNRVVADQPLST
ncbi:ligand-binding sensor domain-containing protein [Paraglaciecola marina]|uniref:ligand-binding sensor domain-containing protein n=1 Tax=Paraglaciecola marina TaxID=2500157 RepID=UPI0014151FCD|nr:ligand-binding sensor domain-containing diguanylate cyclase [Paraglaciecola marina]